jgi:hypothetical protein
VVPADECQQGSPQGLPCVDTQLFLFSRFHGCLLRGRRVAEMPEG